MTKTRLPGHDCLHPERHRVWLYPRRSQQDKISLGSRSARLTAGISLVYLGLEAKLELVQPLLVGKVRPLGFQLHVAVILGLASHFPVTAPESPRYGRFLLRRFLGQRFVGGNQVRQTQPLGT